MSGNNNKKTLEYKPGADEQKMPEAEKPQSEVAIAGSPHQIQLANVRQECIKLAHSAAKGVYEVLADAEIYTKYVMTGEIPKP